MENTTLIELACKAFAAGLTDGTKPPSEWRLPSGRELVRALMPEMAFDEEYRKQLRTVYGAGLSLGQWRKYHGTQVGKADINSIRSLAEARARAACFKECRAMLCELNKRCMALLYDTPGFIERVEAEIRNAPTSD